jgi:hypothetical protein
MSAEGKAAVETAKAGIAAGTVKVPVTTSQAEVDALIAAT